MSRFNSRANRQQRNTGVDASSSIPPTGQSGAQDGIELVADGAKAVASAVVDAAKQTGVALVRGVEGVAGGVETIARGIGDLAVAGGRELSYAGHYVLSEALKAKQVVEKDALKVVTFVSKEWHALEPERKSVLRGAEELKSWLSGIYSKFKAEGVKITGEIHSMVIPIIENSGERLYRDAVNGVRELESFFRQADEDSKTVEDYMAQGDVA